MKSTIAVICLCIISLTMGCEKKASESDLSKIEKASWLLGRWENNSAEGNLSESWRKINDSTFFGESYFVISTDTVFAETIQLENRSGGLFYIVRVPGQNAEKPVSFELTQSTPTEFVFENPNHDFPNRIVYNKVGTDSLIARIFGKKDGTEKSETFKMQKIQ